mmetsp:Transcript_15387/g.43030  ORF Transcript_15387/g.43030 Transcript_15387/m.43030 type:complete len:251 (+) Transcript_15387:67-819(+)
MARSACATTGVVDKSMIGDRKLRLLALHGFSQDAQVFRNRLGSMRKALKSRAEIIFLDAPWVIGDVSNEVVASAGGRADGRTWWTWQDADRPSKSNTYTGWEASNEAILTALHEHHPIDGLLGFSQGATAAALHLATRQLSPSTGEEGIPQDTPQPWFAVLIGGFLPRDVKYSEQLKRAPISVPTLHIYGLQDAMVTMDRSIDLMSTFDEDLCESFEHPGGHMVPTCTGDFKSHMIAFIDRMKLQLQAAP